MINMKLHIRMAEARITQKELSERTGIRQASISDYVNNKNIMIAKRHLDILCKFFNCKVEDLVEYELDPQVNIFELEDYNTEFKKSATKSDSNKED